MGNLVLRVDGTKVEKLLKDLQSKDFKKVYNSAVRAGARVLAKDTEKKYAAQTSLPRRKNSHSRIKPGKVGISRDGRTGVYKVHILQDFMMKWFEIGTNIRMVKGATTTLMEGKNGRWFIRKHRPKSRPSGSIRPLRLFLKARQESEQRVCSVMNQRIMKAIQKINNKKR